MNVLDFCRYIANVWNAEMAARKNEDYEENPVQMSKLKRLVDCFLDLSVETEDSTIEPLHLVPKEVHGDITATFTLVYLSGKSLKHFCEALAECSAVTMDATDNGVCISCVVPNVYRLREPKQYS